MPPIPKEQRSPFGAAAVANESTGENASLHLDVSGPRGPPSQIAYSIETVIEATDCGRTSIFAEIRAGRLKARKLGRRTIILDPDLRAWLAALPVKKAGND